MSKANSRRITFKRTRPNPLFQDWLEELHEEAKQNGSKLEPMLKEALESLSKYPLPLRSGAECSILKGFKKKLCIFLDRRLEVYTNNMNQVLEVVSSESQVITSSNENMLNSLSLENSQKKVQEPNYSTKRQITNNNGGPTNSRYSLRSETACTSNVSIVSNFNSHSPNCCLADDSIVESRPNKKQVAHTECGQSSSSSSNSYPSTSTDRGADSCSSTHAKKKERKTYKPAFRSGGYAILVALLEQSKEYPDKQSLTKELLIERAQKHSEESFTRPKPDSFYTAWSNINRLVTKGLIVKSRSKKVEYSLTDVGLTLAAKLLKEYDSKETTNDIIFNNDAEYVELETNHGGGSSNMEVDTPVVIESNLNALIEMPAGSFDIILLIDKNETGGVTKKNDPTVAQFNKYPDLKHEYRSLKVGDFIWIARNKVQKGQELVLPYVIERKRMDDLAASIKDGRFHEQKFRLRKCGLDNVIYMVENYGSNKHVGLPVQSLKQALANTRVQDGFRVHETDSLTNSARFLAIMTKRLTIEYKDKNLTGGDYEPSGNRLMTLEFFNKSSSKNKPLTVTETFIKMLLQLKGVSVEKALAITNKYKTPKSLIEEYKTCNDKVGQMVLANLKHGDLNRSVGHNVSKSIYQLFSCFDSE